MLAVEADAYVGRFGLLLGDKVSVMKEVLYLSFAVASISFTVTESKLFRSFREWVEGKSAFLGEMVSCGYCFNHWLAFAFIAIYKPRLFESWWLLDYFLTALVVAWISAFQWVLMCWLMERAGK